MTLLGKLTAVFDQHLQQLHNFFKVAPKINHIKAKLPLKIFWDTENRA
jgi:hypothetical protein